MSGWDDPASARAYDDYSKAFSSYDDTSRDLVRMALIRSGLCVLDLCCGTGVTTRAALALLGQSGTVHAVDASAAMLAHAQANISAPNVVFHHGAAEELATLLPHLVDRVICNSAFWQLDMDATLSALRQRLHPEGCLAFNLPQEFYCINDTDAEATAPRRDSLRARMRQVAAEDFGLELSAPLKRRRQLTYETVSRTLGQHNLALLHYEVRGYVGQHAQTRAFYRIPLMTESALPNIDYATRISILDATLERFPLPAERLHHWAYFVAAPVPQRL